MTAASRAGQLHIHRPGDASTTQTDTNEGVLCSPRSRGNASSTLLRCGTLVNNVSDCMHHTKAMHQAEGPSPHEPNHTMHRTPHSIRHDDKHQAPHWSRWALTALAAAAMAACGGGSSEPTTPANQAPTVTLDAPAANTNFFSTDTVHITATASDADGTVAKVEFLADGVKIGEDTTAPFEFDWVNPPVGPHKLTVRAIDNSGAGTLSAERAISSAQNQVPTVSMSAPANNFKANNSPFAVPLAANASDSDGSIAKVEFFKINPAAPVYDATTLVGEATAVGTPPSYQRTTDPLTAGTYHFVARATDDKGDTTTSDSVQVIINASPTVNITAPTAGASIIPGTNYTLRATASDGDGSISKVEFFLNGSATPLGQAARVGTTNEYTLSWTAVTGGVQFTARATDNDGAQTTTASVAANVPPNTLPTVTLDNPTAGPNAPTNLLMSASAADGDGTITGVEFAYTLSGVTTKTNGTLAAGKWTATVPVSAAQFGTYGVTATATDNLGGKTTSASKNIVIAANVPPTVNITSAAAQTLDAGNAPKTLTLTASASDTDGIAKVEFFNGATKIGEDTSAPFQATWANVAAGSYTITAKATDTVGSTTTSAAQALEVTPNLLGSWASLNTTQKAGITLIPDMPIGDPGTDAGQVLTAIGTTYNPPAFVVAMAQALRDMADLPFDLASTNLVNCPGGGTVQTFQSGADRAIKLNNCKTSTGFTLFGGVDLEVQQSFTSTSLDNQCPPANLVSPYLPGPPETPGVCKWPTQILYTSLGANQFRIFVNTATATGNGTPDAGGEPFPRNAYSFSYIECTGTGAAKKCVTNLYNSFVWGNDLAWTGYSDNGTGPTGGHALGGRYLTDDPFTVNGTMRPCQADPQPENNDFVYCKTQPTTTPDLRYQRHFKFENFTNIGGRAVVYGNNGWSEVKRLAPSAPGVELFTVQRTFASGTGSDTVPKTYECTVDANGFWGCVLKP